jgi:transposase
MEKEDFRTVDESTRFLIRKRAIQLCLSGKKQYEVAQIIGVKKETVCQWNKLYNNGGFTALKGKKTGVRSEDKKLLSVQQEKEVQNMIIDRMPDQLKLDYALWTRKAVKELVEREFEGVNLIFWGVMI